MLYLIFNSVIIYIIKAFVSTVETDPQMKKKE